MILETDEKLDFIKAALPYCDVNQFTYWISGTITGDGYNTPYTYCAATCSINDPG